MAVMKAECPRCATLQRELEAAREREMQWGSLLKVTERELEAVRAENQTLRNYGVTVQERLEAMQKDGDKLRIVLDGISIVANAGDHFALKDIEQMAIRALSRPVQQPAASPHSRNTNVNSGQPELQKALNALLGERLPPSGDGGVGCDHDWQPAANLLPQYAYRCGKCGMRGIP